MGRVSLNEKRWLDSGVTLEGERGHEEFVCPLNLCVLKRVLFGWPHALLIPKSECVVIVMDFLVGRIVTFARKE